MMSEPTVFIVDDDAAVRDSLSELVQCIGLQEETYATAQLFLTAFDAARPGCLVVDIRMPHMSGLDLQQRLLGDSIRIPIIFITGHGDIPTSVRAIKLGAVDFLEKPYHPQQMRECIHSAVKLDAKWRKRTARQKEAEASLTQLTMKERAVMDGIVSGKINKAIASELDVSLRTVQLHRASLMKKLHVDSRAALIDLVLSAKGSHDGAS